MAVLFFLIYFFIALFILYPLYEVILHKLSGSKKTIKQILDEL